MKSAYTCLFSLVSTSFPAVRARNAQRENSHNRQFMPVHADSLFPSASVNFARYVVADGSPVNVQESVERECRSLSNRITSEREAAEAPFTVQITPPVRREKVRQEKQRERSGVRSRQKYRIFSRFDPTRPYGRSPSSKHLTAR